MPLDLMTAEAPSLENFVPGDNQAALAALAACRAGEGPQFIYLWGPQGSGKTHLLKAMTPAQEGRVPVYREGVTLYTVDDIERLSAGELEDLFVLMNFVRSNPGCRLVSAGSVDNAGFNSSKYLGTPPVIDSKSSFSCKDTRFAELRQKEKQSFKGSSPTTKSKDALPTKPVP